MVSHKSSLTVNQHRYIPAVIDYWKSHWRQCTNRCSIFVMATILLVIFHGKKTRNSNITRRRFLLIAMIISSSVNVVIILELLEIVLKIKCLKICLFCNISKQFNVCLDDICMLFVSISTLREIFCYLDLSFY